MYGDLIKDLDKALHGNFKKVVIDLFKNPYERDAFYLYKSMKGVGTNDEALVEVLCSRSNEEIKKIIEEYKRQFNDDLERKVSSDTSGNYKKFLISLLQCQRSENSVPNDEECKKLAEELYKAGEGKLGTDEETFNRIFAITSPPELFSINTFYSQLSKRSLSEAVDKEFSGNLKLALSTILESTISPQNYYAKRINKAVKGLGTNDKMLIRNLISREGIDMREIREAYKNLFGKDMVQDIKDDTSGDYQKILVTIASGN
jgi:annexin A7/11